MLDEQQMDQYLSMNHEAGDALRSARFPTNDWEIGFTVKDPKEKRALMVNTIMNEMASDPIYAQAEVAIKFDPKTMQPTEYKRINQAEIFRELIKCIEQIAKAPKAKVCSEMGCTVGDYAYGIKDVLTPASNLPEMLNSNCVFYSMRYDIASDNIQFRFADLDRDKGEKLGILEEHDVNAEVIKATDDVHDKMLKNWDVAKKKYEK